MKKKLLKKTLAAVLALTVVLSAAGAAFADDGNNDAYTYNTTVVIDGDYDDVIIVAADDGKAASLTVTGDVTAKGFGEPALFVSAQEEGTATVQTGDITNTDGDAVFMIAEDASTAEVEVGDVNATGGDGIEINTDDADTSVTVSAGDITADGEGVIIFNRDGTVSITTGEIRAADAGADYFYDWYNAEDGWPNGPVPVSETGIRVNGDITLQAEDPESLATGVRVGLPAGEVTVSVDGNISVEAPGLEEAGTQALGMDLMTATDAEIKATVNGDITVTGMDTWGVEVFAGTWADWPDEAVSVVDATVNGDISASGTYAEGIYADAGINDRTCVTVTGDIDADGDEFAAAIVTNNLGGTVEVKVTGDLTSSQDGMILRDCTEETTMYLTGTPVSNPGGETQIEVTGDVTAEESGIYIEMTNPQSSIDVIVDGTVDAGSVGVLVSQETISDNLTLTVWEIKPNENGCVAERVTQTGENGSIISSVEDEALEKKIQYIIRIEEKDKEVIRTRGTTSYEGYEVALEGDTVTLKVEVPEGYSLANAYNGTDVKVELLKDDEGNYYLDVPRGGAVMLSVEFEEISEPEPEPEPQPDPKPVPEPEPEPQPVPRPEQKTIPGQADSSYGQDEDSVPAEPVPALPFEDVTETDECYDDVRYLYDRGLMITSSETKFGPEENLSRSMFVTVLWRMAGEPEPQGGESFTDVEDGEWYTDAILWAAEQGIAVGYEDQSFGIDKPITAEELITMLWRMAGSPAGTGDLSAFRDAEAISPDASEAISWAVAAGILEGDETGALNPGEPVTRAWIVRVLRAYDQLTAAE